MVGQLLDKLKELGLEENTIVMYSTDNGAEEFSWPDGGTTPFRGEKATNWEGGYRVPTAIRWPGVIKPGTVSNDIFAHEDMLPTLLAAAGVPDVKAQLLKGMKVGDKTFKVHLDGYNITDALAGKAAEPAPRVLLLQRRRLARGAALRPVEDRLRRAASRRLRRLAGAVRAVASPEDLQPALRSVREGRPDSAWATRTGGSTVPSCWCRRSSTSARFLATFKEFPPSQKVGSFSLDQVLETLQKGGGSMISAERLMKTAIHCPAIVTTLCLGIARSSSSARRSRAICACATAAPAARPAAVVERRAVEEGHHRLRRAGHERRRPGLRSARPSASPCSTTTARCGPSSRCTSSSRSRSTASRRSRRSIRSGRTRSRSRPCSQAT